jgi:hypothetical protein
MANLSDLDMSNVQAQPVRRLLPEGDYQAVIVESKMKAPKSPKPGNGDMLELTLEVQGHPQFNGAKLWDNLCIRHAGTAGTIAKARLKAIMDAVGLATVSQSEQLHNRLLTVTVIHREHEGEMKAQVKGYSPKRSSGQPMTQTSYAAPSAGPANPFG